MHHPYPTKEETAQLAQQSSMSLADTTKWFKTNRNLFWRPFLFKLKETRMKKRVDDDSDSECDIVDERDEVGFVFRVIG